jgi:hypothetical protein
MTTILIGHRQTGNGGAAVKAGNHASQKNKARGGGGGGSGGVAVENTSTASLERELSKNKSRQSEIEDDIYSMGELVRSGGYSVREPKPGNEEKTARLQGQLNRLYDRQRSVETELSDRRSQTTTRDAYLNFVSRRDAASSDRASSERARKKFLKPLPKQSPVIQTPQDVIRNIDLPTGRAQEARIFLGRNIQASIQNNQIPRARFDAIYSSNSRLIPESARADVKSRLESGLNSVGVKITSSSGTPQARKTDLRVRARDLRAQAVKAAESGNAAEAQRLISQAAQLRSQAARIN